MEMEQMFFENSCKKELKEVKSIVLHWPGGRTALNGMNVISLGVMWSLINESSNNSYHYLVSKGNVVQSLSLGDVSHHCSHLTYRVFAKNYFGEKICSSRDSPDNYTLSICALNDKENGSYNSQTMITLIELISNLCLAYNLDPRRDVLRHSDISNELDIKCPLGFYEDDEDPDDLWDTFKDWLMEEIGSRQKFPICKEG